MRNNADFINLALKEQKNTFLITKCWGGGLIFVCKAWSTMFIFVNFTSSAHCIRFVCCNLVLSNIIRQIGPAYSFVNGHDKYVYIVYVYACHYNTYILTINRLL